MHSLKKYNVQMLLFSRNPKTYSINVKLNQEWRTYNSQKELPTQEEGQVAAWG